MMDLILSSCNARWSTGPTLPTCFSQWCCCAPAHCACKSQAQAYHYYYQHNNTLDDSALMVDVDSHTDLHWNWACVAGHHRIRMGLRLCLLGSWAQKAWAWVRVQVWILQSDFG